MEIKMKLREVLGLNETLKKIIDDTATHIDPIFKFKLLGIMKSLEIHIANFDIIRTDKIKEYGTADGDSGNMKIDENDTEAITKFTEDLNKVLETTVTLNIEKLKASEVFDKGVNSNFLVGLYGIMEV